MLGLLCEIMASTIQYDIATDIAAIGLAQPVRRCERHRRDRILCSQQSA